MPQTAQLQFLLYYNDKLFCSFATAITNTTKGYTVI